VWGEGGPKRGKDSEEGEEKRRRMRRRGSGKEKVAERLKYRSCS